MHLKPFQRSSLLACGGILLVATAATAARADITVLDAKIAAGKLVVKGTTVPDTWVRLDGQTDSDFNVKSSAEGAFAFGIVYHPHAYCLL